MAKAKCRFTMKINACLFILISMTFYACNNSKSVRTTPKFFHGKITYNYTYESALLELESLTRSKPHTGTMIFEDNNYESSFIGKDTMNYIYSGDINMCYQFDGNGNSLGCENYRLYTDSILSYKLYETSEKVLDQECMILEFQGKYFWNRYYISKETKLNPEVFENNNAYNWSFYGGKSNGGLILKLEHRFKDFTMKGVAVSVQVYTPDMNMIRMDDFYSQCETEIKDVDKE